jgi:triosephosphate isomerase (TIM)
MKRTPLVVANWKMNKTSKEASSFLTELLANEEAISGVEVVICPSFVFLEKLKSLSAGSSIKVGAQNIFKEEKGAYTGEVSIPMVAPFCSYVILGHSERRKYFGEEYTDVRRKALLALDHGVRPIICIGENLKEREKGVTDYVVRRQLEEALESFSKEVAQSLVIAYEPIWAIGTGKADRPEDSNLACTEIRKFLAELFDSEIAQKVRILYGGSITQDNIISFIKMPEIDGALIGGTSLDIKVFLEIIKLVKANYQ